MHKNLIRASIPGKIIELLHKNNEFYESLLKDSKFKENNFPKYSTWIDEHNNYNMIFALAGYSPSNISIEYFKNELIISSSKIDEDKEQRDSLQKGFIIRGIAKRNFLVKFYIYNEFSLEKAQAKMKDGELHIIIPRDSDQNKVSIKIN